MNARRALIWLMATSTLLFMPAIARASQSHPGQLEIERLVMCTTCGRSLDVSSGPSAEQERAFIRREIRAGKTRSQLLNDIVAEHGGDRSVLAVPRADNLVGGLAWGGPIVMLAVLLVIGAMTIRRWRQVRRATTAGADTDAASRQLPAPDVRPTASQ